ncbi:carbon-nitrogen hydrolase family protein [Legionella oakridgensis]|uniref:Nitrilase n=2 Tax=Legionella oakridgensis TaxID=29423 RepID=A0A0W0X0M7_9GAMM|nr:carbon-nitrogen hydrolase family protein [Legionella oakridgensis]AHE66735.1 putative amidohydrolase [Legionella oakridgensis ATCC 33761 = DSM 21215]KTD38106.1 nitrilase [Legionella oakridgensis]STY19867.1 nitrilase [Legionella longbeachae]
MSRVAVIQMVSSANVKNNLNQLSEWFADARDEGAKLLVLPENFAFMGMNEKDKFQVAEDYGQGEIQQKIGTLARQYQLWVIAGTMLLKTQGNRLRSGCLVYDDKGIVVARYDKIHLFDVRVSEQEAHQESLTIEPGSDVVVVDTPIGRVGLSVCYDLRFAELYQQLVMKGAELFTVPSAFTAITGKAHWEVLLRARAIENLCYVLAANQGGLHENGRNTYGHSMIIDPWGRILSRRRQGTGMIVAEIDLQQLHHMRQEFPCLDHHVL